MTSSSQKSSSSAEDLMSSSNSISQQRQQHDYTFKVVLVGDSGVGKSSLLRRLVEGGENSTNSSTTSNNDRSSNTSSPSSSNSNNNNQQNTENITSESTTTTNTITNTIGVDFKSKTFILDHNNVRICLNCYDTSGDSIFRPITRSYFHNMQAFLIAYDVTDPQSFANCQTWLDEINEACFDTNHTTTKRSAHENKKCNKLIKILIGCKADQDVSSSNHSSHVSAKKAKEFAKKNGFVLFYETSARDNIKIKELFDELCLELIANYLSFLNYQCALIDFDDTNSPRSHTLSSSNQNYNMMMLKQQMSMPVQALTSKQDVFYDCSSESLNCNHIILNNHNSKRKNLQTKGLILSELFDFF